MWTDPKMFMCLSIASFQMLIRAKPKTFWCPPQLKEQCNANIRHSTFIVHGSCFMHAILKYLFLAVALILRDWHLVESQP